MAPTVHQTEDGSSTLYSEDFEQFYHNPNGAASESLHVFFETSGLNRFLNTSKSMSILEVGFGTGLNFLLMLDILKRKKLNTSVLFYSIEAFPIDVKTAKEIDFSDHIEDPKIAQLLPEIFLKLSPGMNVIKPLNDVDAELRLFVGKFEDFKPANLEVDFIFHDPFSPEVNAELWTAEIFERLAQWSKPEAVLSTYCAASKARGAMCASGWKVARAPGALGKREMTVASLSHNKLLNFKRVNEKRLAERYHEGDF